MEGEKKRGRVPAGGRGGGPGRQPAAATAASACGLLRETRPPAPSGQSGRPGAVSFALYPQAHEGKRVDDSPAAIMPPPDYGWPTPPCWKKEGEPERRFKEDHRGRMTCPSRQLFFFSSPSDRR
ncbi:hypothetical protein PVAP13_5KG415507 [Panicum virgatum]|uniref:Uncharacterized protein n=1 Tax=Panicum virgatum TaxID=38727 RepID=A0A8T0SRL2_PANVG|nr:hypothetical protein PVAP13_5KG415507 [Panicum virgatum]